MTQRGPHKAAFGLCGERSRKEAGAVFAAGENEALRTLRRRRRAAHDHQGEVIFPEMPTSPEALASGDFCPLLSAARGKAAHNPMELIDNNTLVRYNQKYENSINFFVNIAVRGLIPMN